MGQTRHFLASGLVNHGRRFLNIAGEIWHVEGGRLFQLAVSYPNVDASETVRIGVLTASDRASSGEYEDLSGPEIEDFLNEVMSTSFEIHRRLVPDDVGDIENMLIDLSDRVGCCLIITTGGTGPAPRDVTPEATTAVCDRILPGFGERMRSISLKYVPTAILSRQLGGTRGSTLIINLPGSPKSIRETLEDLFPAIPYCIDLIGGPYIRTFTERMDAYRPPHARRE